MLPVPGIESSDNNIQYIFVLNASGKNIKDKLFFFIIKNLGDNGQEIDGWRNYR